MIEIVYTMHLITFLLAICFMQNSVRSSFSSDKEECIQKLNLDMNVFKPGPPLNFEISPILQQRNQQCLDRCLLVKQGFIDENEVLQEKKIKEQFPNVDDIMEQINQTCPIIYNLTDKCDKAYVIGRCIQAQEIHIHNHKRFRSRPPPPPVPPNQWRKYRTECDKQIAKENLNASTSYETTTGLQSEWCMRRCMLIKRGILNDKNEIQEDNVQKYIFGDDKSDFSKCNSIKNENICREAADIDLCINILTHKF